MLEAVEGEADLLEVEVPEMMRFAMYAGETGVYALCSSVC